MGNADTRPQKTRTPGLWWMLRRSVGYWRPYWGIALLITGAIAVQNYFYSHLAHSLGQIIDAAHGASPLNDAVVLHLATELAALYVIAVVASVAQDYLAARASAGILNDIRLALFVHLQRLSMRYFAHARSGDVVAHFTSDLADIDKGMTTRLPDGYFAIISIIWWGTHLALLQWRLALVMLAGLPLLLASSRLFTGHVSRATYQLKREQARLASTVQENVRAQPVIKSFGLHGVTFEQLRAQLAALFRKTFRANFLSASIGTASSQIITFTSVSFLLFGAALLIRHRITVGELVAANVLFGLITKEGYNLTKKVLPSLMSAAGAMRRVDELLTQRPEVTDLPGDVPLPRMTQEICFADVSFGYTAADLTLERISLTIKSGQYVAVVGPSGSGKSTLLSLLLRFYDPTSGLVTVDGYDLRRVTQESLRAQMAVVFQDTFLFNTTIRGNIGLGRPEVTDEAIEAAARAAEIHETILGWPRGYDTPVGEMGGLLSGGQRQRIAIARAIVCNPAILLLDEPVTGLDPPAEAAIRRTLRRIARGRTIIEVTHRLIAMEHLDQIFVLQGGCLVEQGRHHELLRHRGLYYRLWLQQQSVQSHRDGDEALVGTAVRSNHQDTRQEQGIQPGWDDEQASNGTAVRSAHAWSGLPQPLAGPWIAPSLATDSHHNAVDARHRLRIGDPGGRILAPSPGRRALRLYFMLAFKRGMPQPNPVMVELLEILRGWGIEVETGIAEEVVLRPASFGCQHDLYILKSHADLWLSMAGILHAQGAHILNPYLACLASHNKISADQSLKAADIPIPNSWLTGDLSRLRALTEERALVIKPHTGGRGRDVFVVQNGRDLAAVPEPRQPLLVQEYVPGNELKVYVIGDAVFGIRKIVEDGEARRVVAPISHAVHSIALQCGEVFGLGLYGLDVIEGPDGPVVIDVNYFPSYKGVPGAASLLSEYIVDYATLRSSKPRLQLRLLVPGPAAPMADVVAPEEPAPDAAPDPPLEETLPAEETSPAASAEPIVPPRAASVSGAALASRFAALWSLTGGAIAAVLVAFLIFSLIGLPNAGSSTRPKTTTVTAESAASPVPGATPAPTPPPAASPAASPVQAAVTQPPPPPPPSARPVTGSAAPVSASVAEPPPFDESGDGRGEPPPPPSERQIRQAEQEFLRDFFNNHP